MLLLIIISVGRYISYFRETIRISSFDRTAAAVCVCMLRGEFFFQGVGHRRVVDGIKQVLCARACAPMLQRGDDKGLSRGPGTIVIYRVIVGGACSYVSRYILFYNIRGCVCVYRGTDRTYNNNNNVYINTGPRRCADDV